jgi:hypothetical protein
LTNPLQRGCYEGLAINTIAMPLDQANGSTMVMFFFMVGPFFLVGPVLSWRKRYVQNYVFAFCACGWGLVLFRNIWAGKVCFYVFMFFENKPVDTLLPVYKRAFLHARFQT